MAPTDSSSEIQPGDRNPAPRDILERSEYPTWLLFLALGLAALVAGTLLWTVRGWADLGLGLVILGLLGLLAGYRRYRENAERG